MKITDNMVAPDNATEADACIKTCAVEGTKTFHIPQKVMVFSAAGARSMMLWACESHPLPSMITDQPDGEA